MAFDGEPRNFQSAEAVATGEEIEVTFESPEDVGQFYDDTLSDYREKLLQQYPELESLDPVDEEAMRERFKPLYDALQIIECKLTDDTEINDSELEQVQLAHDKAVHGPIELIEREEEGVGVNLSVSREGKQLEPVDLDAAEEPPSVPIRDESHIVGLPEETAIDPESRVVVKESYEPSEFHTYSTTPDSFTPASVKQNIVKPREIIKQERKFQAEVAEAVDQVEQIGSNNFLNKFLNKSPYESLGDELFDGLVEQAAEPYRDDFMRQLKERGVDQQAFENWMDLVPGIRSRIDTRDKTFTEVVEEMTRKHIVES